MCVRINTPDKESENDQERCLSIENCLDIKVEKSRKQLKAVAKLVSKGTTITTTMDHELEKEAIESVCAKEKNNKICMEGWHWTGFQKKKNFG
ncbi:hypothetical protein Hanom_Chr05g00396821 [Helianthus anomalus]